MTPEQIRLQCLSLVVSKSPQDFSTDHAIARANELYAFVMQDNPPKRGPGRPPKQTPDADKL